MSDYTPTTGEMRDAWIEYKCMSECEECPKEFDRWLTQVKAEAWQEGYESVTIATVANPYRQGEAE